MDQQTADVLSAFPQLYDVDRRFTTALWSYVPYAIRPSPQAVEVSLGTSQHQLTPRRSARPSTPQVSASTPTPTPAPSASSPASSASRRMGPRRRAIPALMRIRSATLRAGCRRPCRFSRPWAAWRSSLSLSLSRPHQTTTRIGWVLASLRPQRATRSLLHKHQVLRPRTTWRPYWGSTPHSWKSWIRSRCRVHRLHNLSPQPPSPRCQLQRLLP